MFRSRLFSTIALAGLALSPLALRAQGTSQTHTVKKGDTLWDLAQQYLGDPFRWPDIYRRNTATVQDPDLIYPDQVLVISGDVAATPGTPADTAPHELVGSVSSAREVAPPSKTIFSIERATVVRGARQALVIGARATAVRAGDYASAPFLWDETGLTGTGRVGASLSTQTVARTRYARPVQLFEQVQLQLPANATGAAKERFVAFRYGPTIAGKGRIVIPTGIFELKGVAQNGVAEGVLVAAYENVIEGQELISVDQSAMVAGGPVRVEFGLRTSVLWLYNEPLVPSLGQSLILSSGTADGLVTGDQVTLQQEAGTDAEGVPLPPTEVAVLQITRVTTWGASAILIAQTEGAIMPGMAGRVSAKMP